MIRPPPRLTRTSPPFPYTTLFRSDLHGTWAQQALDIGVDVSQLTSEHLARHDRSRPQLDENALASEALRRVEQESSTWLVADLARHIATLLPPGVAANAIEHVDVIDRIAVRGAARCLELAPDQDRKSTRLNSSH